jgi:hypothetical protein
MCLDYGNGRLKPKVFPTSAPDSVMNLTSDQPKAIDKNDLPPFKPGKRLTH